MDGKPTICRSFIEQKTKMKEVAKNCVSLFYKEINDKNKFCLLCYSEEKVIGFSSYIQKGNSYNIPNWLRKYMIIHNINSQVP